MQGARILVADDDAPTRALLCEAFQGAGYDVRHATSGPEVHSLLDSEEFEAVVTDLVMPGMGACDLIRNVGEHADRAVIVLVTGYPSVDTAVEAVHSNIWEYVTKPFDIEGLVACVDAGLRHRRLQWENERLVVELQEANRELSEHKSALEGRVCHATASFQASNDALRNRIAQLARLNELAKAINEARCEEIAVRRIADAVLDLTPADYCGILLPEAGGSGPLFEVHGHRALDDPSRQHIGEIMWDALEIVGGPRPRPADVRPVLASVRDESAHPLARIAASMSVQLAVHGDVLGILSVGTSRPGILTDEDHRLLSTIGNQAAAGLESIRAYAWVQNNYLATIQSLAKSLEAKDTYTSGHSARVAAMAVQIAETMELEPEHVAMIRYAATLHDIGKIGVDDSTIRSSKRLSTEELQSVRRHPELGEEILRPVQMLRDALPMIRHHHERWDGTGYPDGLSGEDIPLGARIIAVADSFDAMTSSRPYRDRLSAAEALRELHANRGTQFDPDAVYAVLAICPENPVGPVSPGKARLQLSADTRPPTDKEHAASADGAAQEETIEAEPVAECPAGASATDDTARTLVEPRRPLARWIIPIWALTSGVCGLLLWRIPLQASGTVPTVSDSVAFSVMVLIVGAFCCLLAQWARSGGGRQCLRSKAHEQRQSQEDDQAATLDPLTGLFNRREFEHRLREEVESAERLGLPLGLLMLDVDHFKQISDRYGLAVGDAILPVAAAAIQEVVRAQDVAVRYSNDQVAVIAPGADIERTAQLAERLRDAIEELSFDFGPGAENVRITASVGVASSELGGGMQGLLQRADQALCNAKAGGRNNVRVGRESAVTHLGDPPTASPHPGQGNIPSEREERSLPSGTRAAES